MKGQHNFLSSRTDKMETHSTTIERVLKRVLWIIPDDGSQETIQRQNRLVFALMLLEFFRRCGCSDPVFMLRVKEEIVCRSAEFPSADTISRTVRTLRNGWIEPEPFSYPDYIRGPIWAAVRNSYYTRHERVCKMRRDHPGEINLHHNSYERVGGDELDEDLIPLCRDCHAKFHNVMA